MRIAPLSAPFAVAALFTVEVAAQTVAPIDLHYEAPEECPSAQRVLEKVAERVRHAPPSPVAARAKITAYNAWYSLDLDVDGGHRHVASESCASLAETLAIILALAVDPQARVPVPVGTLDLLQPEAELLRTPEPASAVAEPPEMLAATPMPRVASGPVLSRVGVSGRVYVRARGSAPEELQPTGDGTSVRPTWLGWAESGMLPRLSYGPAAGLWIGAKRWSLSLLVQWLAPQWTQLSLKDPGRGGDISFLGGQAMACASQLPLSRWSTCAGLEAGDLMGRGTGLDANSGLGHGLWLAGVGALVFRQRLKGRLTADVRIGLAVPALRPAFEFIGSELRYAPKYWSFRLSAGIAWP